MRPSDRYSEGQGEFISFACYRTVTWIKIPGGLRGSAGLEVSALNTSAGKLPIISDWAIPAPVTPGQEGAGSTDYFFAIVTEPLIEYHYVVAAEPRVYVLGLEGNLATQYVCVMFGAPIFKGKAETSDPEGTPVTYAHSLGRVTRTS